MSIPGSYLTIQVNGAVIAETTDVSMKIAAKPLDSTTKDSGLNAEHLGGTVKIAVGGKYLMSESGSNWEALYTSFKTGAIVTVEYIRSITNFFRGYGVIKKLNFTGGNSDSLVTGSYGIIIRQIISGSTDSVTVDSTIITVDSTTITSDRI